MPKVYLTSEPCDAHPACAGYSWRVAFDGHPDFHKCFLVQRDGGRHAAHGLFASALCVVEGRALNNTRR